MFTFLNRLTGLYAGQKFLSVLFPFQVQAETDRNACPTVRYLPDEEDWAVLETELPASALLAAWDCSGRPVRL